MIEMAGSRLAALVRRLRRGAALDAGKDSDAELLARFVTSRDESAFELLVWRHGGMVLATCRRILGHAEDTEDAFQAAFLVLARKGGSIRRGTSIPAWLHRVAVRIARRAAAARRPFTGLVDDLPAKVAPDATEHGELGELLDLEIDRLTEPLRRAFVLCYLEGQSNADAARELGCPVGTIESRLASARRVLKERLARRLELPAGILALLGCNSDLSAGAVATVKRAGVTAAECGLRAAIGIVREPAVWLAESGVRAMSKTMRVWAAAVLGMSLIGLAAGVGWANRPDDSPAPAPVAKDTPAIPAETPVVAPAPRPVDKPLPKAEAWPFAKEVTRLNGNLIGVAQDGKTLLLKNGPGVAHRSLVGAANWNVVNSDGAYWQDVAFSPDGKYVVTIGGTFGGGVKLRDAKGKVLEDLWPKGELPALQLAFTPDGAKLIILCSGIDRPKSEKGQKLTQFTRVSVWDVASRKELGHPLITDTPEKADYKLCGYGRFVLKSQFIRVGEANSNGVRPVKASRFTLIEAVSGKEGKSFEVNTEPSGPLYPDPLSPDGKTLVLHDANRNQLRFLDTETGKDRFSVPAFRRPVKAFVFSPDGRFMAAATGKSTNRFDTIEAPPEVVIWDAATGRELARMADKETVRDYSALAFSPDGSFLVAQSWMRNESSLTIWGHLPPTEIVPEEKPFKTVTRAAEVIPARFQSLIGDLSGAAVTDARRIEVLFAAALGRLPTEVEARTLTAQLARREDKAAALTELLGTLVDTAEFKTHAAELGRMAK